MKKSIILLVILIVVVILAVVIALTMLNPPTPQQNLSENGTKLNLQNNNQQYWQHMDIVIENVTLENGTVESFYIEAWVKPGENLTIDLSQLFGYGNERLPTNYTIRPKVWGGMFNDNTNTGNNKLDMVLYGWSNLFYWNNTKEGVDNITRNEYPHDDINEILFTEITLVVDSEGNIIMTFDVPPTLCETIAHIISV